MQRQRPFKVAGDIIDPHRPHIVAASAHSIKLIDGEARIRVRDERPGAAVPMQRQRQADVNAVAHSPHVISATRYSKKLVRPCVSVRAWYMGPCAAVPMQRQRPALKYVRVGVFPHSPHVVAATADGVKVIRCARIRTWHHRPCAAVPMHGQGSPSAGPITAHSPHVAAAANYAEKLVRPCTNVRVWHLGPCAPVPVQQQPSASIAAHSPNVVAAAGHCVQSGRDAGVRAVHNGP